jgi:DNA topoisomerase-2
MILVNGSKGIGTGFSTDIMCYNPMHIADYIINKLSSASCVVGAIEPYYEGFCGTIIPISATKYLIKGKYEIVNAKSVRITELPVGVWTGDYKEYLEGLIGASSAASAKPKSRSGGPPKSPSSSSVSATNYANMVKDYVDMSTDKTVDITITLAQGVIDKLSSEETDNGCNALEKMLKLYTTKSTTNMHMFDENEKLCYFKSAEEIADHFINVRMTYYLKRKQTQLAELQRESMILSNKARFINDILTDTIDLRKKKIEEVNSILKQMKYDTILHEHAHAQDSEAEEDQSSSYKYLTKMPMDMVTEENFKKLIKERDLKTSKAKLLESTSESTIWLNELDDFKTQYQSYKKERSKTDDSIKKHKSTTQVITKKHIKIVKKQQQPQTPFLI